MASVMNQTEADVTSALEFMRGEIKRRGYDIELFDPQVSRGHVQVPAYVGGAFDGVEKAYRLQEIEDAWNTREPEPAFIVSLMPDFRKRVATGS
jgi:hypothetical protein